MSKCEHKNTTHGELPGLAPYEYCIDCKKSRSKRGLWNCWKSNELVLLAEAEKARIVELEDTLEYIIKLNRQTAKDKYDSPEKAESWACVRIARKTLERGLYPRLLKPFTFLPDCKWQGNVKEKPGAAVCFKHYMKDGTTRFSNFLEPCSNRCTTPEREA